MNKFTDGKGTSYREYSFQTSYSQSSHSPLEVKQIIKLTVNSSTRAIPCAGVCHTARRYNTTYLIVSGVKCISELSTSHLTGLNNNNYKCDSKELSFLFVLAKWLTSSEPSAQSKSPSHQNLEETQSPLAQRKSFSVQVCGSGDTKKFTGLFYYMQLHSKFI